MRQNFKIICSEPVFKFVDCQTCITIRGSQEFFKIQYILLQSALQSLWVLACSTVVEYFSVGMFLQSAVASGTTNPQLGGPVIRTFQLPPPRVPPRLKRREPQQRKVELWGRNLRKFCRKWRLPCHFWVLLHAVNLRHGTDGFTSLPKNPTASAGFEPAHSGTKGQHAYLQTTEAA